MKDLSCKSHVVACKARFQDFIWASSILLMLFLLFCFESYCFNLNHEAPDPTVRKVRNAEATQKKEPTLIIIIRDSKGKKIDPKKGARLEQLKTFLIEVIDKSNRGETYSVTSVEIIHARGVAAHSKSRYQSGEISLNESQLADLKSGDRLVIDVRRVLTKGEDGTETEVTLPRIVSLTII